MFSYVFFLICEPTLFYFPSYCYSLNPTYRHLTGPIHCTLSQTSKFGLEQPSSMPICGSQTHTGG